MHPKISEHRKRMEKLLGSARGIQTAYYATLKDIDAVNPRTRQPIYGVAERQDRRRDAKTKAMAAFTALNIPGSIGQLDELAPLVDTLTDVKGMLERARFMPKPEPLDEKELYKDEAWHQRKRDNLRLEELERDERRELRETFADATDAELAGWVEAASTEKQYARLYQLKRAIDRRSREHGATSVTSASSKFVTALERLEQGPERVAVVHALEEIHSLARQVGEVKQNVNTGSPEVEYKVAHIRRTGDGSIPITRNDNPAPAAPPAPPPVVSIVQPESPDSAA